MKIKFALFLLATVVLLSFVASEESHKETSNVPDYEVPVIIKNNSPFNQPINKRLDHMNDSSVRNYQRYLHRKAKSHVNAEIVRVMDPKSFEEFLHLYEDEALEARDNVDMVNNLGRLLGKAIDLQSYINLRAGLVVKKLALLDLKLKQISILEDTIESVKVHPSNISSNLGDNLHWKTDVDNILREHAVVTSNLSLRWKAICDVFDYEAFMHSSPHSTRVRKPFPRNIYYPHANRFPFGNGIDENKIDPRPDPHTGKRPVKKLVSGLKALNNHKLKVSKRKATSKKDKKAKKAHTTNILDQAAQNIQKHNNVTKVVNKHVNKHTVTPKKLAAMRKAFAKVMAREPEKFRKQHADFKKSSSKPNKTHHKKHAPSHGNVHHKKHAPGHGKTKKQAPKH